MSENMSLFEVAGEEYGRRLDEKIGLFEQE